MKRVSLVVCFLLAISLPAVGQTEITKNDFTAIKRLRSDELSFFGIRLGDSRGDVHSKAERAGLTCKEESVSLPGVEVRIFLSTPSPTRTLAAVDIRSGVVSEIGLRTEAAEVLAGESKKLLGIECLDETSPTRLRLLGKEDRRTENPSQYSKSVVYYYDKEGIQLRGLWWHLDETSSVLLALTSPAKVRE
jgi:hypothetical protein